MRIPIGSQTDVEVIGLQILLQKEKSVYSQDELVGLYGFLKSTGEGNLSKMLVGGKMTDVHFRVLMKVVRATSESDFIQHFQAATFPKVKLNAPEMALKETFWTIAADAFVKFGLLNAGSGDMKKAA